MITEIQCDGCLKTVFVDLDEYGLENLVDGERTLRSLAAAIRRGDRDDAEFILDRIAETLGVEAIEQVQQGRFSPEARARG